MSGRETGPGLTKEEARAQAQAYTMAKAHKAALERKGVYALESSTVSSYLDIFAKHYKIIGDRLKEEVENNPEFTNADIDIELLPFLFIVGMTGFDGNLAKKDIIGEFVSNVLPTIFSVTDPFSEEISEKIEIYTDIGMFERQPVCKWCMDVPPLHLLSNPAMRCVVTLGDYLYNESCSNETMAKMWIFSVFAEEIPELVKKYTEEIRALANKSTAKSTNHSQIHNTSKTGTNPDALVFLLAGICAFIWLLSWLFT